MTRRTPCPGAALLRQLLDDVLPPDRQAGLHDHLEECPTCPRVLEALAGGGLGAEAARRLRGGPGVSREAALQRLLGEPDGGPDTTDAPPGPALDFLTPCDRPDLLGKLGDYEVEAVVGRGGMGVVLRAFDPVLRRVVAIKVLAPAFAGSPTGRRRFAREAVAAAVVHDHVITIHAVAEVNGLPYLVMQYVPGESLQEYVERAWPLEPREIVRLGLQIAQGLAAAHAQGLVHRDIKPANILLEDGVRRAKISDFGLARAADDPSCTQAGVVAGTPDYMAPEQARGEAVDGRADLFSLGCVLYTLCTGRRPFGGGPTLAVLKRVCEREPTPIPTLNPDVPEWLAALVRRLMAKKPSARYPSAAAVAERLAARLAAMQQPGGGARPRRGRVGLAAGLVLLLGAFGVSEAVGFSDVARSAATVLRVRTPDGTLAVEVDDPDVRVAVDGTDVRLTGRAGVHEVRLRPGLYLLTATKDGRPVRTELVSVERGGKTSVRVALEPPPPPAAAGRRSRVGD